MTSLNAGLDSHYYTKKIRSIATTLFLTGVLTACGEGSGSSVITPIEPVTPVPSESMKLYTDPVSKTASIESMSNAGHYAIKGDIAKTIHVGEQVGFLAVHSQSQQADHYQWSISSANAAQVVISAAHQPASSFVFKSPGNYQVKFTAYQRNSYHQLTPVKTTTYQVKVVDNKAPIANLKVDRAARSGGSTSVYFDTGTLLNSDEWDIHQVSGPPATITKHPTKALAQILLPRTDHDQVIKIEASLRSNPQVKDAAYILLQPSHASLSPYFCDDSSRSEYCLPTGLLSHHYAYRADSRVADMLAQCVMSYQLNDKGICNLAYLPFIGQVTTSPSIDDIMDRVVVSEDWMGENFEQFLISFDHHDDFKRLLRSATAIVISDDIDRAFYWSGTGALYLSAESLWLTPEQRDRLTQTINDRTELKSPVKFLVDYEYEKDGQNVVFNPDYLPSRERYQGRSLQAMGLPLASLLYHELAHANDAVSMAQLKATDQYSVEQLASIAPYDLVSKTTPSQLLAMSYPLKDPQLFELAQVCYGQAEPSVVQSLSAEQVADRLFSDVANDGQGYYSASEDLALMFEEAMMLTRFGVNRHLRVMEIQSGQPITIRGQKNRIADPLLHDRVSFIMSQILPEVQLSVSQKLNSVRPSELCAGTGYFDYKSGNCQSNSSHHNKQLSLTGYQNLAKNGQLDEFGRPIGTPRHLVIKLPDPRQLPKN